MNVHGGNLRAAREQFGKNEFLDFSANINPLGIPEILIHELHEAINRDLTHYPDPECLMLRRAIGQRDGVDVERILCGNGASEILFLALQALEPKRVLIPIPSFCEYEQAAKLAGAQIDYFQLASDWSLNICEIPDLRNYDAIIIGNPNNPTSTLLSIDELLTLARMCEEAETMLIIDEAFIELTLEGQSMIGHINEFKHMLIIRAFTKSLAIPGLRLGYGLGDEKFLRKMQKRQITWSVNALAQSVAKVLPHLTDYMDKTAAWLRDEIPHYFSKMKGIQGLTCFKPHTNFMLWKVAEDERDIRVRMADRGILIRPCANFMGLDSTYFRTAISSRENNERLFDALRYCAIDK